MLQTALQTTFSCNKCSEYKPALAFYRDQSAKYGLRTTCKVCDICTRIRLFYKIDVKTMWDDQRGQCLMCSLVMEFGGKGSNSMVVDHDWNCCPGEKSCGRCVRGLLHNRCNLVLGEYESKDFLDLYTKCKRYLTKPHQTHSFIPGRPSHAETTTTSSGSRKIKKHTTNCRYRIDFDSMWKHQKGCCAVCSKPMRPKGRAGDSASVDHARNCCASTKSCGKCVRGLVHKRCNVVLGRAESLEHARLFDFAKAYTKRNAVAAL